MRKSSFRLLALSLIALFVTVLFQNCGPTFVTDQFGQVQMSSFEGPIEYPREMPSKVLSDLPQGSRRTASANTKTCTLNSMCSNGVYLRGSY